MLQKPGLFVGYSEGKGRGVFTSESIKKGDLIEICHIIKIPKAELPIIHKSTLHDYYFLWGPDLDECVLALGLGSLYNHDVIGNAEFILDFEKETIDFMAISDIEPGEEILVNYHGESGDESPLWWN